MRTRAGGRAGGGEVIVLNEPVKYLMENDRLLTAPPQATVQAASRLMALHHAGAVLVMDAGRLLGIFTERDVVFRVIAQGRSARTTRLGEVMTPDPVTIGPDVRFGRALRIMQQRGFRHLPVLDAGRVVGIVAARLALDPELEDFVCEVRRREQFGDPASDGRAVALHGTPH
jgi:CBS domain-containing protein